MAAYMVSYLKASPLPPAPPATSQLVTGRTGRICRTGRTGRIGRLLDGGFERPNLPSGKPEGSILAPWGTILAPWDTILVAWGFSGTSNGTPWGPDLDFYRFWVDFGTLLGPTLGSF